VGTGEIVAQGRLVVDSFWLEVSEGEVWEEFCLRGETVEIEDAFLATRTPLGMTGVV
jgi:hypothetical protein